MKRTRILAVSVLANFILVALLVARAATDTDSPTIADPGSSPSVEPTQSATAEPTDADPAEPAGSPTTEQPPLEPVPASPVTNGDGLAYTFDGAPQAPTSALRIEGWDIQAHSRDPDTWHAMEEMEAQHGPGCEAPNMAHHVSAWEDTIFKCNNHVMTALNASDYGVIYLTPGALVDFSAGPAIVQWDMSTDRQSVRDWPDVWISAYETNMSLPLDKSLPDLQGPPRNAVHVSFNTVESAPILTIVQDGEETDYNHGYDTDSMRSDIADGTNQAATRQTFRLTLSATQAKFERLASETASQIEYWSFKIPDLGFRQGVVQLGHHSYTPTKDDAGVPGTWHWDNVQIAPAKPFTIIGTEQRFVENDGGVVTFAAPAPEGARLRFSAIGAVTVDGQAVDPVVDTEHPEHFNSYFVPIPAGATQVRIGLEADSWYEGPFFARDFSVWAGGEG